MPGHDDQLLWVIGSTIMKILASADGLNKLVLREVQARLWIGCQIPREYRAEPLHIREIQGKFKPPAR